MESENPLYVFTTLALEQFLILFDELQEEDKIPKSVDKDCLRQLMMDKILEGKDVSQNNKNDEDTLKNEIIEKSSPQSSPQETQTKSLLKPHQINLTVNGDELDLPYLPQCVDYHCGGCINLKIRGGLYTPCMEPPLNGTKFCKACTKIVKEGKSEGTLEDRENTSMGMFRSKRTNKQEITYATYLTKRDYSIGEMRDFMEESYGDKLYIPDEPAYTKLDKSKAKKLAKKTPASVAASKASELKQKIKEWMKTNNANILSKEASEDPENDNEPVESDRLVQKLIQETKTESEIKPWLKSNMCGVYSLDTGEDLELKFVSDLVPKTNIKTFFKPSK